MKRKMLTFANASPGFVHNAAHEKKRCRQYCKLRILAETERRVVTKSTTLTAYIYILPPNECRKQGIPTKSGNSHFHILSFLIDPIIRSSMLMSNSND